MTAIKADCRRETEHFMISIVMPAYNAEKTISASIRSVLSQTFPDWELIIVNDCSKDRTEAVVKELIGTLPAELSEKLHVLSNEKNLGVSESRNKGIRYAHYDWIALLDSDDLWDSAKLAEQTALIEEKPDASIIFTGSAFINEYGDRSSYELHVPSEVNYRGLLSQNLISCSSVLIKRKLLLKNQMLHDELHEDFIVWLALLRSGYKAYGIDKPLLIYRLSASSKSGNKFKAACMTFRVYRYIGLNLLLAVACLCAYTVKNTLKYRRIYAGFSKKKPEYGM